MGDYKPRYGPDELPAPGSVTIGSSIAGMDTRTGVEAEEAGQRRVAESATWLLAKKVGGGFSGGDSRVALEELGFIVLGEQGLFYEVQQPEGWTKTTEGLHTDVMDANGVPVIHQFYKAAPWDTNASLTFSRR